MAADNSIEASARRLNKAMDTLEAALGKREVAAKAAHDLEQELQALREDRSRLAQELDKLKQRNVKLEKAGTEVSRRIGSAIGAVESALGGRGR